MEPRCCRHRPHRVPAREVLFAVAGNVLGRGLQREMRRRERQIFEVRNPAGTRCLPWNHEKNFAETYAAFARALETGTPGDLATGADGLIAIRIARTATEQVITDRR